VSFRGCVLSQRQPRIPVRTAEHPDIAGQAERQPRRRVEMSSSRRRQSPFVMVAVLGLALAALASPAFAYRKKDGDSSLDRLTFAKRELRTSQTLTDAEALKDRVANRADMTRFKVEYGSAWRFLMDERTGHLNLLDGGAIPFIPGPANKLSWENFGAANCRAPSCIPVAKLESLARDFLTHNRGALQVNPEELILDPLGAAPIGNSIYFLRFQWVRGGVPVEGGSVFLAINNGNLIQVGIQAIGSISLDPKPSVSVDAAWQTLKTYVGGMTDKDEIVNRGSLAIIPITPKSLDPDSLKVPFGKMIDYVLVHKLAFRRPGVIGTWEGLVNAHTGELIRFRDSNDYGHIQGGIYKTDKPQIEVTMPFPKADYGAGVYADASGNFPATSGTSTMTGLNLGSLGISGGVLMTDNCGAISLASSGAGLIDFGNQAGVGTDCTTPGFGGAGNTHASRTQYWNVTEIKMKGITYLPSNTWLQGQLQDIVNISAICNAYWDGVKLNFFKSGGGCSNTGELPGVSLHEWGHGMDSNDGSGVGTDNKPVESRADWTALLQTHQSCTGSGFFMSGNCSGYGDPCLACTGIRDADFAQHTHPTPWTPQNNGLPDPGYSCSPGGYDGPCGWEDHCESGIATQALWDFVNRDLVGPPTNLDIVTAWQLEDRLFYTGMPQSTNMYTCTGGTPKVSNGCGAGSLYTVMRAIDDDGDGTGNGTPHAAAIFAALNRHGIACGAVGDPTNQNQTSCPALTTPTLTATANSNQVNLSWTTGGASATRYFLFRNETDCGAGFTKIATVSAPTLTYTDTTVVHGLTYYYRVQAATANDSCVSPMSNCSTVTVSLPGDQDFYVRDWNTTTSVHDDGAEPSTNPTFWHTSDVWNHSTNAAGVPNASGWYDTDNMNAGLGALGDNYAFVRIYRNATGSAASVSAHFFVSPFGTGSAFQDAGVAADPSVPFAVGDAVQVLSSGYLWHQDPIASIHACLAVQISTTDDPYTAPSLLGKTPGPADYLVINDNNKAQRNLDVSHNTFHFAGLAFALIHNSALFPRDLTLRFDSPAGERLPSAPIEVVGGRPAEFKPGGTLTLPGMQPGENRWIAVRHQVPQGEALPYHFAELEKGSPVNGFTILAQPVSVAVAIRGNLRDHVQVFNRLAAAFGAAEGKKEAEAAQKLQGQKDVTPAQYLAFLKQHVKTMGAIVEPLVARGGAGDTFGALATLKNLGDAAGNNQAEQSASEHAMLLNRLDSFATMLQKAQGDPADILQMVRWQEALYRTRPSLRRLDCAERVVRASQEFIRTYSQRKAESYLALLRSLSACFSQTAKGLDKNQQELEKAAAAMGQANLSLAALEKAHREFLLVVQDAAGSVQD
jgi:hypothetical protein